MATFNATWELYLHEQQGLSSGVTENIPGGALWRKFRVSPFHLSNPESPRPDECQTWPRGTRQTG